ncbi:putative trihelix transcription factor ASR3 [Cocos nucifera]|uniref:Putative trihelix transcription factor ASR3 n=1 Tax=Cocos nucifera TaxID=13894 RepID=A0A8K0HVM7_COCNU|nr:putative trihelix transcription factor ASR3 [Cocos nucifera]
MLDYPSIDSFIQNQNQCKWDNLLHDNKKVRNYKAHAMASIVYSTARDWPSYWVMEWYKLNSKCKSIQRRPSEGGMAGMEDIGSGRKQVG